MRSRDSEDIEPERILAQELGRLAAGGGIAAPNIPTVRFETVVGVGADPQLAATRFSETIGRLGRLVRRDPGETEPIVGVIGGGFLNMNPAVVEIRITRLDDGRAQATVTGLAKEGLIKQGAAEKAVRRILEAPELAGIIQP